MQKIHTEQIVHYGDADRRNRQPVYVVICVTEADGSLYAGFGPNDAKLLLDSTFDKSSAFLPSTDHA